MIDNATYQFCLETEPDAVPKYAGSDYCRIVSPICSGKDTGGGVCGGVKSGEDWPVCAKSNFCTTDIKPYSAAWSREPWPDVQKAVPTLTDKNGTVTPLCQACQKWDAAGGNNGNNGAKSIVCDWKGAITWAEGGGAGGDWISPDFAVNGPTFSKINTFNAEKCFGDQHEDTDWQGCFDCPQVLNDDNDPTPFQLPCDPCGIPGGTKGNISSGGICSIFPPCCSLKDRTQKCVSKDRTNSRLNELCGGVTTNAAACVAYPPLSGGGSASG